MGLMIINHFYDNAVSSLKKHWVPILTEEEKKITLIALATLSFLAIIHITRMIYRSWRKDGHQKDGNSVTVIPSTKTVNLKPLTPQIQSSKPQTEPKTEPTSEHALPNTDQMDTITEQTTPQKTEKIPPKEYAVKDNGKTTPPPIEQLTPNLKNDTKKISATTPQISFPPNDPPSPPPPPPPPPPLSPLGQPQSMNSPLDTPQAKYLRQEEAKLERNQIQRLTLADIRKEGSTLNKNDLDRLEEKKQHCKEIISAILGSPGKEFLIKQKEQEIEKIDEKIHRSKIHEFKLPIKDFNDYINNKLTTIELKLIWGCFQKTQPQKEKPDPWIEFYETYPDKKLQKICADTQSIYKLLFENCSNIYLTEWKKLIEDRDKGSKKCPTYQIPPYETRKTPNKHPVTPNPRIAPPGGRITTPQPENIVEEMKRIFAAQRK